MKNWRGCFQGDWAPVEGTHQGWGWGQGMGSGMSIDSARPKSPFVFPIPQKPWTRRLCEGWRALRARRAVSCVIMGLTLRMTNSTPLASRK